MLALAGEVADGVALNYLPASHVPWSVEQVRKGGNAEIYAYVHAGVCEREEGVELARRDLFSYAVVDSYARNFERAGYGDEVAEIRARHADGDRAGALAAVSDRMVDGIDVMGDADTVARHDAGLRRRRRRRAGADAAALGRRTAGRRPTSPSAPPSARRRSRRWSSATRSCWSPAAPTASGARCAERFAAEAPRGLAVVDLDGDAAAGRRRRARRRRRSGSRPTSAARPTSSRRCEATEERFGPIDLLVSNAGIGGGGGVDAPDEVWQRIWEVNLMAHVYAARAVLPGMLARGEGYLLNTASAAGLLTNIGNAPYSVTKHAAVGPGRVAGHHLRRPGDQGVVPVPAGRAHEHDGQRRPVGARSCCRRGRSSPRRSPRRSSRACAPRSS